MFSCEKAVETSFIKNKRAMFEIEIRKIKKLKFYEENRKKFMEKKTNLVDEFGLDFENHSSYDKSLKLDSLLKTINLKYKSNDLKSLINDLIEVDQIVGTEEDPDSFNYKLFYKAELHLLSISLLEQSLKNEEIIMKKFEMKTNTGEDDVQLKDQRNIKTICLKIISNLLFAPVEYINCLLNCSLLELLSNALSFNCKSSVKSIYWSLANIIGDIPEIIPNLIKYKFIDFAIENKDQFLKSEDLHESIIWFISNFFNSPFETNTEINFNLLFSYKDLMFSNNIRVLLEMITAIDYFLKISKEDFEERIEYVISLNIFPQIFNIMLMEDSDLVILNSCLEILGKISSVQELPLADPSWKLLEDSLIRTFNQNNSFLINKSLWTIINLIEINQDVFNDKLSCEFLYKILLSFKENCTDANFVFNYFGMWNVLMFSNLNKDLKIKIFLNSKILINFALEVSKYEDESSVEMALALIYEIIQFSNEIYTEQ